MDVTLMTSKGVYLSLVDSTVSNNVRAFNSSVCISPFLACPLLTMGCVPPLRAGLWLAAVYGRVATSPGLALATGSRLPTTLY